MIQVYRVTHVTSVDNFSNATGRPTGAPEEPMVFMMSEVEALLKQEEEKA